MEKLDLCRLCLVNGMNANLLASTKTMERTMRQFNMLYSVSAGFVVSNFLFVGESSSFLFVL